MDQWPMSLAPRHIVQDTGFVDQGDALSANQSYTNQRPATKCKTSTDQLHIGRSEIWI